MRIGIDLGGTKIETAALNEAGRIIYRHRVETPAYCYQRLLEVLADQIKCCEVATVSQVNKVGICIPGVSEETTGKIKNANLQVLNEKALKHDLERLCQKEIRLINDANSFAWSEYTDGAAREAKSCFGVIIGTGVGGGVVINNHVISGVNGISGEWGHNPLPDYSKEQDGLGTACYCGRYHCIESFLSGTGFAQRFNALYGTHLTAKNVVSMAREGDVRADYHLKLYGDQLARALGSVINLLDPDVVVLGGGMSNVDELYEIVPTLWNKYIFATHGNVRTRLVKALHGDSSGVRGAAWL